MQKNSPPERSPHTRGLATVTLCLALASPALALDPNTTDPEAISKAVDELAEGDRSTSRVTLTLIDSSGRKRVRKTRSMSKNFPGGTKSIMFFESPADVRNTGMLTIDYDDGNRDDDQWLYLPSLHKATRISSSDKSGSFMGTDITYADMTKKDRKLYTSKIVQQSVMVGGEDCWVIEQRPKTEKEKKATGYLKTHTWISKSKLMPMQMKSWIIEGKKLKYIRFSGWKQHSTEAGKVWSFAKMEVRTVRNKKVESRTIMEMSNMKFDDPTVTDDQFSERRLEQGI